MRAVVQRVRRGTVEVDGVQIGSIDIGFVVLLGVTHDDTIRDARYLAEKVVGLRVFDDENGKMNLSLTDIGGSILAVSQFTLYGDCRKGRRPGFSEAAPPDVAEKLYDSFCAFCASFGIPVACGRFGAHMKVAIINDGPVTLLLESRKPV